MYISQAVKIVYAPSKLRVLMVEYRWCSLFFSLYAMFNEGLGKYIYNKLATTCENSTGCLATKREAFYPPLPPLFLFHHMQL